ncbi:hypothetical protein AFK24_21820 [Pseudomonas syringae]|uniref:Uncharacterized protein n=1 Tax=Pseudomonas syringae TaxID=317 RepID=A0A1C7YYK8_PSESX|nr:hypothetical protein AFK24_21820 [Pseudomonas syringae]
MARRAYRQDVGMVLKKTRLGGFFVGRGKVYISLERGLPAKRPVRPLISKFEKKLRGQASLLRHPSKYQLAYNRNTIS